MMKFSQIVLALFLATMLATGCSESESGQQEATPTTEAPKTEQVQKTETPAATPTPASGEPDQYGRMPGDEHYGHNHPPRDGEQAGEATITPPADQTNTETVTPTGEGEPDQYGRMPGDAHYGHGHE